MPKIIKNSTKERVFGFIREHSGATAKDIIYFFGLNAAGVFRHLKKLQDEKRVYKVGKPPKVKYFIYAPSSSGASPAALRAINWAISGDEKLQNDEIYCPTRDVFQARTDRLVKDLRREVKNDNLVYLLSASAGEIGNNSFDHNLGNWMGAPGAYFDVDLTGRELILADRGQGVFATIKKVKPEVKTADEALLVAFTETISGRAPEKRGNGLKFVRKVVQENRLNLKFYTGGAMCEIVGQNMRIEKSDIVVPGVLAIIKF